MRPSRRSAGSAPDDHEVAAGSRTRWASREWLICGVVVLLLLGLAAQRAYAWRSIEGRDDARQAATEAASAEVVGLISISSTTSDADITTLLDGATAEFLDELESQVERLRSELDENEVEAEGSIDSAAVSRFDDETATVIVAASGTVDNKQTTAPEPRSYRLEVMLVRDGDDWLVSGLEFVA